MGWNHEIVLVNNKQLHQMMSCKWLDFERRYGFPAQADDAVDFIRRFLVNCGEKKATRIAMKRLYTRLLRKIATRLPAYGCYLISERLEASIRLTRPMTSSLSFILLRLHLQGPFCIEER